MYENNNNSLNSEIKSYELEVEPSGPDIDISESKYYYKNIEKFYDRVRSSLNTNGINITDELIDLPENAPMAELRLKSRVPTWDSLDGEKQFLFDSAMVYMTCYMLCSVAYSKSVTEQTTPSLTLKYSTNANQKPCERFIALVDDLVAEINGEEITNFLGFKVTAGSRGCCPKKLLTFGR